METPNLNKSLRKGNKKPPVDEELRELRGFAVEIKEPLKMGEAVRQIADIIDGSESSHHQTGGLPSLSGPGSLQQTFGKATNYQQYGNQGLMATNPYEKSMNGVPYGTIQSMRDQYDHMGSHRGQFARASPRFTQINRTVGEFISLQSRLHQDQANQLLDSQQKQAVSPEQQLKQLKDMYMQSQVQQQQRDNQGSIQDPFETINETQTNSMTDDYASMNQNQQNAAVNKQFQTVPVPGEIRTSTRERRTARSMAGRNTKSSQSKTQQVLQPPASGDRSHVRRISQEVSQRSHRQSESLGHPQVPYDPNEMMAMRGNQNTRRFQNFMSKVIASVKTRTQANRLGESEGQSQVMAIPESQQDFAQTRMIGENSMMLSGQSSGQMAPSELAKLQNSNTPANIRASARREIGMFEENQSSGIMNQSNMIARIQTQSQSGFGLMGPQQQPRAAEQVAYLLKQVQRNKDKVFIPLDAYTASTMATTKEATILKDSKHPDRVEQGNYVFSQQGFIKLGNKDNPTTDFISKEKYIQDGVDFMIIGKVPFFKKFLVMKNFKRWRYTVRARCYERNRQRLAQNFIFARPMLAQRFKPVIERTNQARFLNFIEIKEGVVYGKLQQFNLEQRCQQCCKESKTTLQQILTEIKQILTTLKQEIDEDDKNFIKAIKHAEVEKMLKNKSNHQAVVMFSKERAQHQHIQGQMSLSIDRHGLYNKLVQFISRYLCANLIEMLFSNKAEFQRVFCNHRLGTEFEVSLCFNKDGKLDSDPSIEEHKHNFEMIFKSMEDSIFKNQFLSFFLQDLPEMFYSHPRISISHLAQINMRRVVNEMEKTMQDNKEYQQFGVSINSQLMIDINQLKEQMEIYSDVQEVQDFTEEWNKGQASRQLSLNMGFYNETFEKIQYFNSIIARVPSSNTRLGTILLETMTIKKLLTEMPQAIMNSIRDNVTSTMDNETRLLKEDLSKTSEILEQTPTSLNVYVEQVNTLKFVKQKQKDFDSKYDIIHRLKKQCLEDNIKVAPAIEMSIHHVQSLYKNLPKLCMKAREGLDKNKESMEKIMKGSSAALSKKIKAFEKKYVDNYLQEESRLEDCSVTLEELFKRSTAIHEIKSKVMLYKEFLKLLYEDDPKAEEKLEQNKLSCAEDCDFLQEVHKHTIRLWQNLLFWKKRKRMCYETPFLKLDLSMIQRSITKIMSYFEDKLPANKFVAEKCVPLTRQIQKQVKETSIIVDFAKELHKESLQRRHWVQFFTLIKAQHLKNSTTFTIIDLSEYKIQNYSEDIKLIINHAFTESRYENVFKSIKAEWEKAELRILPFKDSDKDYVIANTDILSDSIEESLGTLETLHKSDYAAHVRKEISDLVVVLRKMLAHLDKWIQAQKYWVTLDPIYNSGLFQNIFANRQRDFLETRSQFRRIMWSSYRNPQAMYNLMIDDRMKVYGRLTEYYLVLQQKTHEYLEQKRLSFNRFFFLNDSQFLDFLMLANSNQDFSVYINILFQGAHNLFISQIKPSEHVKMLAKGDDLGLDVKIADSDTDSVQSSDDSDVETALEAFMGQAITQDTEQNNPMNIRASEEDLPMITEPKLKVMLPNIDCFKEQNEFDPVFKIDKRKMKVKNKNATTSKMKQSQDSSDLASVSDSDSSKDSQEDKPAVDSKDSLSQSEETDDEAEADKMFKLQNRYVLGMLSSNHELFLFDRQVKMNKNVENWLVNVEDAMRVSLKKNMKNAILRFANQPIEEWICDYPQQVAISTIHMIISQEINDTLANVDFDSVDIQNAESRSLFHEEKVTIGKKDPNIAKVLATVDSGMSKESRATGALEGERDSNDKSGKNLKDNREKQNASEIEEYKAKILPQKLSNVPPLEQGEQHANFLDEAFGENTPVEAWLDMGYLAMRQQENRMNAKSIKAMQAKIKAVRMSKKPDYKEQVLSTLQYKGLPSLWLRLAFWVNKCIQLIHKPKQERYDKPVMNFEMLGVHRMQIKSIILFLKYLQDLVDRLTKAKVTDVNDFEWQSKLRAGWSLDDEGIVQCGGWQMNMGYEYLGTYNRMMIVPITERYFVFMSSSLREKSSVMFQCIPEHQFAAQIVEEMASLCSVPFKTVNCSEHTNLASVTQLLNGIAMSQVWVFLEYMDRLPLIGLSILLKEIQLIHQQFVAGQFANAVKMDLNKREGMAEEEELAAALNRKPVINIGIFGSIQHMLPLRNPTVCAELMQQVRTAFRTIQLVAPDLNYLYSTYLVMENFTLPLDTAILLQKFFTKFEAAKKEALYTKLDQPLGISEEMSLQNMRTALKLSKLLADQEWSAFITKQIAKDAIEFKIVSTIDKFEVESWEEVSGKWFVKQKDRQMYLDERERWAAKKKFLTDTKFQIELDALKEGFRQMTKNKVAKEWREAKQAIYEIQKKTNAAIVDESIIDTHHIEASIDQAILSAFEGVVAEMMETGRLSNKGRDIYATGTRHVVKKLPLDGIDAKPEGADVNDSTSLTAKAQPSRQLRLLQRKSSIISYKFSATNLTPFLNKKIGGSRRGPIKHGSTVQLVHSVERERKETAFRDQMSDTFEKVAEELKIDINIQQSYNCIGIVELMRRNKGILISGPQCSGKTQLMKIVTIALKRAYNVTVRSSFITPETFSHEELFGPTQAFSQSLELQPESNAIRMSVFDIILNNYKREKQDLKPSEVNRLIQSIYLDSHEVNADLGDSISTFLRDTNTRERDYHKDTEFILSFDRSEKKIQQVQVQHTPMRFPNGNVIMMPSDLFFFIEVSSLANISPLLLSQVGIVNTQNTDVTPQALFLRQMKLVEKKHDKFFKEFDVNIEHFKTCAQKFVLQFIMKLNDQPLFQNWPLWNMKAMTLQFFVVLNAFIYRLEDNCKLNLRNEDPMDYPFDEQQRDIIWNIMLVATTWSFGAVLDKELRRTFEEQSGPFKNLFNITFATPIRKFTLFDIFYDVERLTWALISEKLDYKIKVHFNSDLNQCVLPTTEISQAYFLTDYVIYSLGKEKDLNKHMRLIGPQSSSKTVILNTFEKKLGMPISVVSVPMTAYLTMDRLRFKIEELYVCKRKNTLIPKDSSKQILILIDDIHLQRNLKIEVLEFIRAWTTCRGYFDVAAGFFKKVADFGSLTAENSNYQATTNKKDRFAFQTTTLYCEEISIENAKPFIQTWFTTDSWSTSTLITKYYILITNALDKLLKQIKRNEASFSHSSLSKLHQFQYVANFCYNVVVSSVNTEKDDVFCTPKGQRSIRREEDALADIFCYEVMRSFGDRIMRPKARSDFISKLSDICLKEFLCDGLYTPAYIDSLILGDYHTREAKSHVKLCNITFPIRKKHAIKLIQEKVKTYTGNQLLQTLLDIPTGLNDLFKMSRMFFKEGQHLAIIGLPGSGKHELMQLSAIVNDVVILELNVPCFGQPLKFVTAFKNALKSTAKLNQNTVLQISETQMRDPIYYDYVYMFISSIVRMDECVLFDEEFKADLAEIEAQHIRKLKKVTVPDEATCFKQAVEKIKKMCHIVFLFSDLMSYKETFQLFPQLEYCCEVMFLDDINLQGYLATADNFLARSNVFEGLIGEEQILSKSLRKVHTDVLELLLNSFYSDKMKENISWEGGPGYGRCQFVFPDREKLTGNVFAGAGGFQVTDNEFRQTLFNMPVELGFVGKHRFAMFLEVFRYIYDLLSMHMSIRKSYYQTFIAKRKQFLEFYKEVKAGKQYLHDEQTTKKLTFASNIKSIEETQRQLKEKQDSIGIKEQEIEELREELEIATNEIDEVIKEKDFKLSQYLDKIIQVNKNEFDYFLVTENFSQEEKDLLNILAVVEQVDKPKSERIEYTKSHFDLLFYHEHKDDLQNMLSDRRRKEFDEESFNALNKFIKTNPYTAYNERALTSHLYDYFKELYYKLNVKNTMATTYFRIQEINMQIDSNIFSVNYAIKSIGIKQQELENQRAQHEVQKVISNKLSRQIEEAQISHMRTEAIEEHIMNYSDRIKKRLANLDSRVDTLLGDSILMAASVVYLGPFAPEERETVRNNIRQYLNQACQIDFSFLWKPIKTQKRDTKPTRNIFWHVLKDIGLKEILSLDNMPAVLSPNDLAESLFCLLFAPSLPVVCDPTGQLQEFVRRTFLKEPTSSKISAADIFSNEKIENVIKFGRMTCVTDLTCMRKSSTGLSQDHPLMKRLSTTLYNGFDFHDFRTAQMKRARTIESFFTHQASVNKRVPCFDEKLQNISLYQVQVFQPRFDFQLNNEFLQNATFICAAPSHQSDGVLENNVAIIQLKEVLMKNFLIDSTEFENIKEKLRQIDSRMWSLESNFENSFLLASSETLKKLVDYKQLMDAVLSVNKEKEAKKMYMDQYHKIMDSINLLTEVGKVIIQIYMALKQTCKIMNETTYNWKQFLGIVDKIINRVISKLKIQQAGRETSKHNTESIDEMRSSSRRETEVEVEINQEFFCSHLIPQIHLVMMSNVKIESKSFFNFVLSLRFALIYGSVSLDEYQFILNQLIKLKEFWKWRDAQHPFVKGSDFVEKNLIKDIRTLCFKFYPEALIRKVFEHINTNLGAQFTNQQLSIELQTKIQPKFGLTPVQMITFGFLCPDHEFQARMVSFMYEQMSTTFDFQEDLSSLKQFIKMADWQQPISLFSAPTVNPVNLVTSVAKHYGIQLTILRTDPVSTAAYAAENLEQADLRDLIISQLNDIANSRYEQKVQIDQARFENLAQRIILESNSNQVIAKQNWRALKDRFVNMDESNLVKEINLDNAEETPVQTIMESAREGNWVLICPVQFPQYFTKLMQSLKENEEFINENFRLLIDFQGFTQNEIPDSILSDDSVTLHLDESNVDENPSFGDIWQKILDDSYLHLLTDQEVGQAPIRRIDFIQNPQFSARDEMRKKSMKYMYEATAENQTMTAQFQEFLSTQKQQFEEELTQQQKETLAEMEEKKKQEQDELEAQERALQLRELDQVNEEDDDGAFSNASEKKGYNDLKNPTEQTESVYKAHVEDDLKNEQNSANLTVANIAVSSRGTASVAAAADPLPVTLEQEDAAEEVKRVESGDAINPESGTRNMMGGMGVLKRQLTMTAQGDEFEVHPPELQMERRISLPSAQKQTRVNSHGVDIVMPSQDGLQVVGQGYSNNYKSEMKNKSTGQQK